MVSISSKNMVHKTNSFFPNGAPYKWLFSSQTKDAMVLTYDATFSCMIGSTDIVEHKRAGPLSLCSMSYYTAEQGGSQWGRGGAQSICLTPPINKLFLLKTAAFVLNFKLCPPPLINAWPPKSTELAPVL